MVSSPVKTSDKIFLTGFTSGAIQHTLAIPEPNIELVSTLAGELVVSLLSIEELVSRSEAYLTATHLEHPTSWFLFHDIKTSGTKPQGIFSPSDKGMDDIKGLATTLKQGVSVLGNLLPFHFHPVVAHVADNRLRMIGAYPHRTRLFGIEL
jgi:hypothetical protein